MLAEVAPVLPLPFGGRVPLLVKAAPLWGGERQVELHPLRATTEQDVVDDRLHDLLRLGRDGHGDPQALADGAPLAGQHVKDDLVDLVVAAIEQHRSDMPAALAEAVNPAFALFQAVRVPRQVVVDHGVEVVLQVDAFAQTLRGDQHAAIAPDQLGDLLAPLLVTDFTGDRAYLQTGVMRGQFLR